MHTIYDKPDQGNEAYYENCDDMGRMPRVSGTSPGYHNHSLISRPSIELGIVSRVLTESEEYQHQPTGIQNESTVIETFKFCTP